MDGVLAGGVLDRDGGIGVGGFLLALVTAGALTHVAVRMKGIEVAYALGRERRISADLEEQRRRLQIEIGMLKDPGRVVSLARDKLKMGPPAAGDIVRAGPGALAAIPAPAAAPAKPASAAGTSKSRPTAKPARTAAKSAAAPAATTSAPNTSAATSADPPASATPEAE